MNASRYEHTVKLVFNSTLLSALLLVSNLASGQVAMPRTRGVAPMQDHYTHPQLQQTTAKPSEGGGELKNPKQRVLASMNNGATPDGSIIVGLYVDPPRKGGTPRGYVVQNGVFSPYDIAGSTATQIWGINRHRDFVGLYDDANGNEHGFLQNWGSSSPITIDVPSGSPFNATLTDAFAINSHGAIVSLYIDTAGMFHGYVAQPNEE